MTRALFTNTPQSLTKRTWIWLARATVAAKLFTRPVWAWISWVGAQVPVALEPKPCPVALTPEPLTVAPAGATTSVTLTARTAAADIE